MQPPDASLARRGEGLLAQVDCEQRARQLGVPVRCVELLVARGLVDADAQRRAIEPRLADLRPPQGMAGFADAVDLIVDALAKRRRFGVFGDYDVDGVTTATILTTTLEAFGGQVVGSVASRDEGYGLTMAAAGRFVEAGVEVLLVGDCGTSDFDSLTHLAACGVQTVVIDHHQVPERMPPAAALINPHRSDCGFPFKGLCSAGVAFYLAAAVRTAAHARGVATTKFDPRSLLDLAALATVCDMVPLVDENRVLVSHGLARLRKQGRPGLVAMLMRSKVGRDTELDEEHLAFQLGPRLNAAGRLGSAAPAFELLRSRGGAEAGPLADRIESLNAARRELQRSVEDQAHAQLQADPQLATRAGLVVADARWVHGVVGIAAAGLVARYRRPAAVVAIDEEAGIARGSVRSFGGVDVRRALADCAEHLDRFGGHPAAAGLSLDPAAIPAFAASFADAVARQQNDRPAAAEEELHDGQLVLGEIDDALRQAVRRVGPYGVGFPPPRFLVGPVRVVDKRVIKGAHVALTLEHEGARRGAIWFGSIAEGIEVGTMVAALGAPVFDDYRRRVQLRVERLWSVDDV